jgi:hypothetical protein
LDGGSSPSRLDEDAPTIMAMTVMDVAEVDETYDIPERMIRSINSSRVLIPFFLARSYRREVELPR